MDKPVPDKPIKIIITDQYTLYRGAVCTALSARPGISITGEAANGKELLDLLEKDQPDIVIMDIQMPVMDGLEALPVIKRKYPAVKVIILSMHNDWSVIRKMMELGANAYLTKEVGSADIYEAIMGLQKASFFVTGVFAKSLYRYMYEPVEEKITGFSTTEYKIFQLLLNYTTFNDISTLLNLSERIVSIMIGSMKYKTGTDSVPDMITKAEGKLKKYHSKQYQPDSITLNVSQPATIRVIVTDDHSLFRTGIKNSLAKREGIQVIGEAENGAQLLQLLEKLRPDVITLNLQMPVLNGFETLPLLRERYPHLKVLMISMHNDHGTIRKAIELGAHGYLTKEAGSEDICNAISFLFKNWIYINRTVAEALLHIENERNPVIPPQMS